MLRWSVLGMTLAVDAPTLWSSFMTQTTTVESALVRVLITIPIVAVLLGFVRLACATPTQDVVDDERSRGSADIRAEASGSSA